MLFHASTFGRGVVLLAPSGAGEPGEGLLLSADGQTLEVAPVHQTMLYDVDSESVIEEGDLLFHDNNVAQPVSRFAYDTSDEITRTALATVFLGVALQSSGSGESDPIRVSVDPNVVHRFTCDPSTYHRGGILGPMIVNQVIQNSLVAVFNARQAIARVHAHGSGIVTEIDVTFASAFSCSSNNVNALLGGGITSLPSSDPGIWGALWVDNSAGRVVKVSAG